MQVSGSVSGSLVLVILDVVVVLVDVVVSPPPSSGGVVALKPSVPSGFSKPTN